jgi:hypothetical protein
VRKKKFFEVKVMGITANELIVLEKKGKDDFITIVCSLPSQTNDRIYEFTILELINKTYPKMPSFKGIVLNRLKGEGLITLGIKNTLPGEPLKLEPLLRNNDSLDYHVRGRVLPPLQVKSMQRVLITLDGFWIHLIPKLIDNLKNANCEVAISGPLTINALSFLRSTGANQIIPIDTFTALSQQILNSDADTIISLNTPLWQKKVINLLWSHWLNKNLIIVNNQFLE